MGPLRLREHNGRKGADIASFDVVMCIEVVEHLADPASWLRAVKRLLSKGGEIILTTPNKSAFPQDAVWETDAPPVHLWWFTPCAIKILAAKAGFSKVRFIDFSKCRNGRVELNPARDYSKPMTHPTFDRDGSLCFKGHRRYVFRPFLRNVFRRMHLLDGIRGIKRRTWGPVHPRLAPYLDMRTSALFSASSE